MLMIENYAPFDTHRTWYRITGNLASGKTPVIVVHGGPGCTHDYVDAFADLAETGRPVIHYDQLGNGNSTRLPDKGKDFWTVDLFLREMDNLIDHLGIGGGYILIGQSWGGMLSSEHAVRKPSGLKGLVIANSPPSMKLWVAEANRLREDLPEDVQATLLEHEAAGTIDSEAYKAASRVFYNRHVCRLDPWPPEVSRTFQIMDGDSTVYNAMNGPTEFHVIGTLKDWSVIDRLHNIETPTLLISGRHDEATPKVVQPFADNIANVSWTIFEDSSHMPHVEQRDACMTVVAEFLDKLD
ncbi:alpha/beta fold hydrolase [Rhodobacterales bacterium]|nr:alpha/beta fold hydrolase [Rhodobacterales bacterium]